MDEILIVKNKNEYLSKIDFFKREIPLVYGKLWNKERTKEILEFFDNFFNENKNCFFAAVVGDDRIKSIARFQLFDNIDAIFVTGLMTAEEFRKQGCAYRLLKKTLLYAQRNYKNVPIKLWVDKQNISAINLYKKLGFKISTSDDKTLGLKFVEPEFEDFMTLTK